MGDTTAVVPNLKTSAEYPSFSFLLLSALAPSQSYEEALNELRQKTIVTEKFQICTFSYKFI